MRLFDTLLKPGGIAVAPGDAVEKTAIAKLAAERGCQLLTYGRNYDGEAALDVGYHAAIPHGDGWTLSLEIMGHSCVVSFALPGTFQIDNALCALALVIGGALGNATDRLSHGAVVDFLDLHIGDVHWPAFNVADASITIGVLLILIDGLFAR